MPYVFILLLFCLAPSLRAAPLRVPAFHTAAAARTWGEQRERAGDYEDAAVAFDREAELRRLAGDPQGAEVEVRRARRLTTDLRLAIPVSQADKTTPLAKFEPVQGCYIGVRDDYEGQYYGQGEANAEDFARRLDHPVAIAYDYDVYGRPFPSDWARREAARGRAVQIAWEPNDIAAVQDDDYLEAYAQDAARSGAAIFLRFGGEMNGAWTPWHRDPSAYVRAFRIVHGVMARNAPNVAMVWAPNPVPFANIDRYYPGDDAVDWVGLSLYVVRYYDDNLAQPAWQDNPATLIEPVYRKYAARKPICIVEGGVTRRSRVEGADADGFAAARIEDLMDAVRVRFPRLKMLCWFDRNNLTGAIPGRRLNDYSLPNGSLALDALRRCVQDPYFLGQFDNHAAAPYGYLSVPNGFPTGYHGPVIASLSTYSVYPSLEIDRGESRTFIQRPFRFLMPPTLGPLVVTVHDEKHRAAKTLTVFAP